MGWNEYVHLSLHSACCACPFFVKMDLLIKKESEPLSNGSLIILTSIDTFGLERLEIWYACHVYVTLQMALFVTIVNCHSCEIAMSS